MSDFVPRDMLPDLWEEILKRHWTFLETEESIQKLEERKKLEGCLKEFLCIVPHDRKFFLPETSYVLKRSILDMDEFTAYKAIIGFENISQYANNLFTKPWRKEFRILKMYSGFFQHEIKSNLLDAEKLFEAMGYRRLSDDILILDGPICPDQVTNVSRDAMAAYMECQIMKYIYGGLISLGLTCSWQDIFYCREMNIGGTSQTIKRLAYAIQERRMRKEKEKFVNAENCYAAIQSSPQASALKSTCQNCVPFHMPQSHHPLHMQQLSNNMCPLHHNLDNSNYGVGSATNNKIMSAYPAGSNCQQHAYVGTAQPQMSHSRSLEHYNEAPVPHLPHRHSFDHQQQGCTAVSAHRCRQPLHNQHVYESPYDCLDGISMGSSVSYAAVAAGSSAGVPGTTGGSNYNLNAAFAHPYNVSGNRYPLPYNISNQLNSHYATPTVTCNGIKGETYSKLDNVGYATVAKQSYPCNYHVQPSRHNSSSVNDVVAHNAKDMSHPRLQNSFPPLPGEHLIDFDDRAPLTPLDFLGQMHQPAFPYGTHERRDERVQIRPAQTHVNATYAQPQDILGQHAPMSSKMIPATEDAEYGNYVYARPLPRSSRIRNSASGGAASTADRYVNNTELITPDNVVDNKRKMAETELKHSSGPASVNGDDSRRKLAVYHSSNDRDTSDLSSTLDDFVHVSRSEKPTLQVQRSPTQASKNQDGVGSFESWDYVFQNLERSGYSKDLSDRGDLLVQSLDLDSLHLANGIGIGNSVEKKRASHTDKESQKQSSRPHSTQTTQTSEKVRASEKPHTATEKRESKTTTKQEKSILKQHNANTHSANSNSNLQGKKTKSALKSTTTTTAASTLTDNNNGNGNTSNESRRSKEKTDKRLNTNSNSNSSSSNNRKQTPNATTKSHASQASQVVEGSPDEWSCRFCTFLNPDTKRICEMCCRSKDFNLEATVVSNTPTCV